MLYAKYKTFDEVVNSTIADPIDRKDVSKQLEGMLEERNNLIDEAFRTEEEKKEKEREERRKYNEENNIVEQRIERVVQFHNLEHNSKLIS